MVGVKLRSRDVRVAAVEDGGKCAREIRKMDVRSGLGNSGIYGEGGSAEREAMGEGWEKSGRRRG